MSSCPAASRAAVIIFVLIASACSRTQPTGTLPRTADGKPNLQGVGEVGNHRGAVIRLKLVNERGGEALANTQWSVLTPGGDVVKEAVGAFPKVILAEGEYSVVARNEDKTYNGKFKVEPGFDREIEVMAR